MISLTVRLGCLWLSLYRAKLFLTDIHIFNIHPTPPPTPALTRNFVTIWTSTRDGYVNPCIRLHSEDISMSSQKRGRVDLVIDCLSRAVF